MSFLLINGIKTLPDDMFTWTDRAERELQLTHNLTSEKIEYHMGTFRRPSRLRELADNLAEVVREYNKRGQRPHVIAHSNGNVLLCRALSRNSDIRIGKFFMVMPACWSSCKDNGLNRALLNKQVDQVIFFGSDSDNVVKWGGKTSFLKVIGLGYGSASYTGLTEIDPEVADKVEQVRINEYRHSTFGETGVLPGFLKDQVIDRL